MKLLRIHPLLFLLFVMLFLFNDLLYGQKYYVSPEGNNKNSGTRESPLADFSEACIRARDYRKSNRVNQPVEIIALEGEYFMLKPLFLSIEDNGTKDAPLVIKADDGAKPVFRGGVKIEGFEKVNETLWRHLSLRWPIMTHTLNSFM